MVETVGVTAPVFRLSLPLALARAGVDRVAERRTDEAWLAAAWSDPHSRVLVVADGKAAVDGGDLVLVPPGDAPEGDRFLLGDDAGVAYLAVHVPGPHPDPRAVTLRQAGGELGDRDAGLMVHAVALANWHGTHGFCARCGAATEISCAGHVRRCPVDGSEHYPRTDPAVIVLVVDEDDRCLLARGVGWPEGRFSTLAGFVEPGESPEQAVVREVHEETGIAVTACTYAGSQPWPFPSSLMLGYFARAAGVAPRPDGVEISEAHWYSRAGFSEAIGSGAVKVPPSVSISRRLIEGWYGSVLEPTIAD